MIKKRNAPLIVLGVAVLVVVFIGILFAGQIFNPPPVSVAIAVVDIPAGTVLTRDMVAMDSVHMNAKVIGGLVREGDMDTFVGGTIVEPVHKYQPLPKAAISAEGNPAAANRLALGLSDPNLVGMVVPVNQATSPEAIVEGDYVDLNFGVNSSTQFGAMLTTKPTESPFGSSQSFGPAAGPTALPPTELAATTPTPEPLLMLPVAKTIVSDAKVMAVIREEKTSTVQDTSDSQLRTVSVPGKIIALVVAIPREAQELLQFAIDNGSVRVAVLSAKVTETTSGDHKPTLGMTWNDLVSLVRMDRDAVLATGVPANVMGPGANAIEATRNAGGLVLQVQSLTTTPEGNTPSATPKPK